MTAPAPIDIAEYLASDPAIYDGSVTIRGRRLPVFRLGLEHVYGGQTPAHLAAEWDLSLAQVHAALSYFFANRDSLEAEVARYDGESDRIASVMEWR